MKRILIALLVLFSETPVFAQWSVTPEAGMTAVNSAGSENWEAGYRFGAAVEYAFSDLFSLKSGLHYTNRSSVFASLYFEPDKESVGKFNSWILSAKRNRGYVQLPITANLGWNIGDGVRLNMATGPYLGYRIKTSGSTGLVSGYNNYGYYGYDGGFAYPNETGSLSYLIDGGYRLDWGTSFSVGIEAKSWVMNVGYDLSLAKEDKWDNVSPNFHTINITLGYKFRI